MAFDITSNIDDDELPFGFIDKQPELAADTETDDNKSHSVVAEPMPIIARIDDILNEPKSDTNSDEVSAVETESNEVEDIYEETITPGFVVENHMIIEKETERQIPNAPINALGLSTRSINVLVRARCFSLKDIVGRSVTEIQHINQLGVHGYNEIKNKLNVYINSHVVSNNISEYGKDIHAKENMITPGFVVKNDMIVEIETGKQISDDHIDVLDLSVRSFNALMRAQLSWLTDLVGKTEKEIQSVKNLGNHSSDEVRQRLNDYLHSKADKLSQPEYTHSETQDAVIEDEYVTVAISVPLEEMGLSARSFNCLKRAGITNSNELMALTEEQLRKIKNLGDKSLEEILETRKKHQVRYERKKVNIGEAKLRELVDEFYNAVSEIVPKEAEVAAKNRFLACAFEVSDRVDDKEAVFAVCSREEQFCKWLQAYIEQQLDNNRMGGLTFKQLDDLLPDVIDISVVGDYLSDRIESGELIENSRGYYIRKYPRLEDIADDLLKGREKEVFFKRMRGITLDEIGKETNVTRERIRQIEAKAERKLIRIPGGKELKVRENRFKELFTKYSFTPEAYCAVTGDRVISYRFMSMVYHMGNGELSEMPADESVPPIIRERCLRYLRELDHAENLYPEGDDGIAVPKNRTAIEDYLLYRYCRDEMTFDDFIKLYHGFIADSDLNDDEKEELGKGEDRVRENRLNAKATNVLWKYGKRLRYYNLNLRDYSELFEVLDLGQYKNIELSTLKFVRAYPELMKSYDIRDEYELHNLLRKLEADQKYDNLTLSKAPTLRFGEFDRDETVKQIMLELAPVSTQELAAAISDVYGFREDFVISWFVCIKEYYRDGIYSADYEPMPDEHMQVLKARLTDDFYFISEIREAYKQMYPQADETLISSYNLKRMGFVVNSTYVIQHFDSASKFFIHRLTKDEITELNDSDKKYAVLTQYYAVLDMLRDRYEIIEYEPNHFINIRRLKNQGIEVTDLKDYCIEVYEYVKDRKYFTVEQLIKEGFTSKLDILGFEPWFYSSVLRADKKHFSYIKTSRTVLFGTDCNEAVTRLSIISQVVSEFGSIDFDEMISYISEEYNIELDRYDVKMMLGDSSLYYDDIFDKVYIDRKAYYDELNAIDDNDTEWEDEYEFT